jgi:MFS family permease
VTPLTDVEKMRRLPWLLSGDMFNGAMFTLTFAGPVFLLFLSELELNEGQIGFILSLIPFCGIVAPFIAPTVARFGYKRIFVSFWAIRTAVISLLLLTPLVVDRLGVESAFAWVGSIIFIFATCRAIAETGGYPWRKEAVPTAVQGKFQALSNMTMMIGSIVVTTGASYVIGTGHGLDRFMLLIGMGVGLGVISVWLYSRVPGGRPVEPSENSSSHLSEIKQALSDREFMFFLSALGLATIGGTSVISFIPLFMKEQVGLNDSQVVLLSSATYAGALLSSYLWGWAADRYGSKPVMQFSLDLMLLLPITWFVMPRHSWLSAPLAMLIALLAGVSTLAWQISWMRYLFVNAMPVDKKAAYTAVYYAWFGFVSGFAPLLAGLILEQSQRLSASFLVFTIDPYTPLFTLSVAFLAVSIITVSQLRSAEATSFRRFAGMFVRGNPLRALESLIMYNFAGDEITRIATTERMGNAKNPLSSYELIEALQDPSFNVRFEAISSIGRMPPEPELIEALIAMLAEEPSELTFAVTRTLGRLGDRRAIPPLRQLLSSKYHLLEASGARALSTLGDTDSIPLILEKFRTELNPALRVAHASALGRLRAVVATGEIFALLRQIEPETLRAEVGLALARMAGGERYYMQHWRTLRATPNIATAQAILAIRKLIKPLGREQLYLLASICAEHFAQGDSVKGVSLLKELLGNLPTAKIDPTLACILGECASGLAEFGDTRLEFILLSLHTLNLALHQLNSCDHPDLD